MLAENRELARAADEALRANQAGQSLYNLRSSGVMSEEAHTLLTARKLQVQEQAMNNATKRIIEEDVAARIAHGEAVPRRYHTFNATQGNRNFVGGSNVNADLDQTFLGLRKAADAAEQKAMRERMEQILQEEANKLGFDRRTLDMNVYRPQRGISDVTGAAPNSTATLENIGQTTGTSQQFHVRVTRDGRVVVGDAVGAQGREGVLAGRMQTAEAGGVPVGKDPLEWMWDGHQGAPVLLNPAQRAASLRVQLDGLDHARTVVEAAKYANRGKAVGLPMGEDLGDLLRTVAGQKDPLKAQQILEAAGIRTADDLRSRLGG